MKPAGFRSRCGVLWAVLFSDCGSHRFLPAIPSTLDWENPLKEPCAYCVLVNLGTSFDFAATFVSSIKKKKKE